MPPIIPKTNGHVAKASKGDRHAVSSPIPRAGKVSDLAAHLEASRTCGTDEIVIGSSLDTPMEVKGSTMADAAKIVDSVKYLVKGWIPFGMVTGLVAEPGVGKSAFALWLARTIVTGCDWFNGMKGPAKPGSVLWCGNENDMAINLDRVRQWQVPMDRILLPFDDDPLRPVVLTDETHLERIEASVNKHKVHAVFIDSLRGGHDGDENDSRVGRVLQNLSAIAERTKAGFIVVHHTKKLTDGQEVTANSSRGSNAILALMRVQIGFDKPDPGSKWVRVRMLKRNLPVDPNAIGMLFTDKGLWFGPAPQRPQGEGSAKERAEQFLRAKMKPGTWHKAAELIDQASATNGISENALHRAKEPLGVVTQKRGDAWCWLLPMPNGTGGKT